MRRWVASKRLVLSQIPRPVDGTVVHANGSDADRVLIVGPGLAVGWGATSHDEAFPGALARALSDLTARGTDVDVIADSDLRVGTTAAALEGRKLWRFDVIVITLGSTDALDLLPASEWRAQLAALLDTVAGAALPSTRIVVVGAEPVGSLSVYDGPNAARADALVAEYNAVSAELCASAPTATYLALASTSADYPSVGIEVADELLDSLNASREESAGAIRGPAGQAVADRERERQRAVDEAAIVDTPDEDRFDRIVTMARQLYGTSGAAFAIVDNNRVWHKSKSEGVPVEVPKDQSFCSTTIILRGPHVVPDMRVEAAPADTSAADEVGVRFYAGYPVESPSGEQIGALCIFDEKPRVGDEFDSTMLRQLALLIQAELRVDAIR
jgi:hypothetical protein